MLVVQTVLAFVLAIALTELARVHAVRQGMLDAPSARSLHEVPTPRGGGASFVVISLVYVAWKTWMGDLPHQTGLAWLGGGALVATTGWLDDRYSLSRWLRGAIHAIAAAWALAWLGGLPSLDLGLWRLPLGPMGFVLGLTGIVWLTNLYNFMDGIDGLAASQGVFTCAVGGALLYLAGDQDLAVAVCVLGAACGGFLTRNWQPARVFMGDVGSGFLGFTFAILAVSSENEGRVPLLGWSVLLAIFIVDATVTLLGRVSRGEPWYHAHRSHAYQRAVAAGYSHAAVTSFIMTLNLFLGLLALMAWKWPGILVPANVTVGAGLVFVGRKTLT